MSKAGRGHYNEDDYYDEDDDHYDEYDDYDDYAPAPAKKAPAPAPKKAAPAPPAPRTGGKNPQPPKAGQKMQTETPVQLAAGKGGFGTAPVASPGSAKKDIVEEMYASEAEREVLMSVMPNVKAVVGTMVSDTNIVKALRATNYDANAAVERLLGDDMGDDDADDAGASSSPQTQPGTATTSASDAFGSRGAGSPTTAAASSGGGKKKGTKLVLGGGSSAASPAPASPAPPATAPAATKSVESPANVSCAASPARSSAAPPTAAAAAYFPTADDKTASAAVDDDGKKALSLVMAGHVDTGKSTILGHLLVRLGHYTDREVAKLEALARQEGKATFHFAWILDQSPEERRRGVTIDSGVHHFETDHRRVSILDAPGHKDYVASMISSATQADIALFTVSASRGEFESGLAHMTKEHLSIVRTLGLSNVVVLVNKMDSVDYSQERFDEVVGKVRELAAGLHFRDGVIAGFCPVSGYQGVNLLPGTADPMPWYSGPSLVEYVDACEPAKRMLNYPLRFVVADINKQVLTGKVETGIVKVGDQCVLLPSGNKVTVRSLERPHVGQVKAAQGGNSVDITVQGDLLGVVAGDVMCPPKQRCPVSQTFEAHIQFFSNLPRAVLPGTKFLLQIHAVNTLVTVKKLVKQMDPKTGQWSTAKFVKCLRPDSQGLVQFELPRPMPIELAEDNRVLGRFILRLDDETVGGGLVRSLPGVAAPAAA